MRMSRTFSHSFPTQPGFPRRSSWHTERNLTQPGWFRIAEDRVYDVRRGCEITLGIEFRFPCLLQYEAL